MTMFAEPPRGRGVAARSLRQAIILVVLAVLTAGSACGGGGGDQAPNAQNFGQLYAQAICASDRRCNEAAGCAVSGDGTACVAQASGVPTMFGMTDPARSVFNPEVAAECLKAAKTFDCDSSQRQTIVTLCTFAYTGHVPLGGACSWNSDCEQPTGGHAICNDFKCVTTNFLGRAGAPCDITASGALKAPFACAFSEGYQCTLGADGQSTCQLRAGANEPCHPPLGCLDGSYCDPDQSVCLPNKKEGDSCSSDMPCAFGLNCANTICVRAGGC